MLKNTKILGKIFYGMHFEPGVAEYREPGTDAYRILVNENTIRDMNATFAGKPVYVEHVDEVKLEEEQEDGWVSESFFNAADGKTWVKFIVITDRGLEAIRNGWKLSNAYIPKDFGKGGMWHGVDYQKEVIRAEYEHLAIVRNPRYEESIIMTPDQFKAYNEKHEFELRRVANQQGEKSVLNFFKKTKVDNSADFEQMMVTLPKSKKELTLTAVVNELDAVYNMQGYAHPDHMVKCNDEEEMTVNKLVGKYLKMKSEMDAATAAKEEDMKKENDDEDMAEDAEDPAAMNKKKKNDEKLKATPAEKKDKAGGEKEEKEMGENDMPEKKKNHFEVVANAAKNARMPEAKIDLDQLSRGKARYGSK